VGYSFLTPGFRQVTYSCVSFFHARSVYFPCARLPGLNDGENKNGTAAEGAGEEEGEGGENAASNPEEESSAQATGAVVHQDDR
jgi:hypothetical protein